jgi:ubiquinone/menaquinone biosynthesis C-methylase UbiE
MKPAAPDSWRTFDVQNPDPGYFQFDWLSARHPDLYHKFALSTEGLMSELDKLVDLSDLVVVDVGAGTGRATMAAARRAKEVIAVDAFESVVAYGTDQIEAAGLRNVTYKVGSRDSLPVADSSVDAVISAWAVLNYQEAYRVLKAGGYLIELGGVAGSLCGELTETLASTYPDLITEVTPAEQFDPNYPTKDSTIEEPWNGITFKDGLRVHDFTYVADYGSEDEAAAIFGRLYGPLASKYIHDRQQSTVAWRLRIYCGQVSK